MSLNFISRGMPWTKRFKRLYVLAMALFLLVSVLILAFGKEKNGEFQLVIFDQPLNGIPAVIAFYFSLLAIVAVLAAGIASMTWLEDKIRMTFSPTIEESEPNQNLRPTAQDKLVGK